MDQELYGIVEFLIERAKKVLQYSDNLGKVYLIMRYPDKPKLVYFNLDVEVVFSQIAIPVLAGIVKLEWNRLKPTRPENTELVAVVLMALTLFEAKNKDHPDTGRECILTTVHTPEKTEALRTFIMQSGKSVTFSPTTSMELMDYSLIRDLYPIEQGAPVITDTTPVEVIVDRLKAHTKKHFKHNNGSIEPKLYFVLQYPGENAPVYFPIPCRMVLNMTGSTAKMPEYSQLCWFKKKAESPVGIQLLAVCMISDSWLAKRPKGSPYTMPSEDPMRQEVLIISICYPTTTSVKTIPYERRGRHIEFKEELPDKMHNVTGTMTELYPRVL